MRNDILHKVQTIHGRRAGDIWVIMNKEGNSVVRDPGLDRPYSTVMRYMAESIAREVGGVAVTLADAIKMLSGIHNN